MNNLFVTDLDGTALGGDEPVYERFSAGFAAFLDTLSESGWGWCINTSWNLESQMKLVLSSPVKSRPSYLISEFGRRIARVSGDSFERLEPFCSLMDQRVASYTDTVLVPLLEQLNRSFIPDSIICYGHLFSYTVLKSKTGEELSDFLRICRSNPEISVTGNEKKISVIPSFLGKGVPLREIMRMENLTPDQIWTAGDQLPDLAMMQPSLSGNCVCPANAADEVKSKVLEFGGCVSPLAFGRGVVDAAETMMKRKQIFLF